MTYIVAALALIEVIRFALWLDRKGGGVTGLNREVGDLREVRGVSVAPLNIKPVSGPPKPEDRR